MPAPEVCRITRKIEFDAGHRIPDHKSKCFNVHGHRYVLEATIDGPIRDKPGSDYGMILDFGDLKTIMMETVHEYLDHALIGWRHDTALIAAVTSLIEHTGVHKTVWMETVPTVENLARLAFDLINKRIATRQTLVPQKDRFTLTCVRLYETPNCWADYTGASE